MVKYIPLTKGKSTIVDDDDYERLNNFKWTLCSTGYAYRQEMCDGRKLKIYLHRYITSCPKGKVVDHASGDKLDNTKSNLRICTYSENLSNKKEARAKKNPLKASKYQGVYKNRKGRWYSQIRFNSKTINIGTFDSEEDAAMAYNIVAYMKYGEYAYQNERVA